MIRGSIVVLAAAAAVVAARPSAAATPGLSGKYFTQATSICQPQVQVTYSSGSVSGINVTSAGSTLSAATIAKFDVTKQKVTLTGVANQGSALLLADNIGHSFGSPFAGGSVNARYDWSNTDTTVTINGTVYQAVYGDVKDGVAVGFMLEGIDGNGCSVTLVGSR